MKTQFITKGIDAKHGICDKKNKGMQKIKINEYKKIEEKNMLSGSLILHIIYLKRKCK